MSLFTSLTDAAYAFVRPIVHATDGEAAHNLTLNALQPLPRARRALTSPVLATDFALTITQAAGRYGRRPEALVAADLRHADGYAIRLRGVSTVGAEAQKKR